ncbi:MAG: hypothetical protein LBR26_02015 [Prevotella sp.]|jgi:uncharacterized protein (TIGR02145 family)|nr:hypothetical protein [Prevotella sp.]
MKKKIFSVVLVVAGLLSGCSSEESVSTPETLGKAGTLTFSFPSNRRSVTYAVDGSGTAAVDDVDAIGSENEINDVSLYMFENTENGKLVNRQSVESDGGDIASVSIDVTDFVSEGGNFIFYAVANVNGNLDDNFRVGEATLDDFTYAVSLNTGSKNIQGKNMLMVGYKTIIGLSPTTPSSGHEIYLHHRVARFDIDNLSFDDDPTNDNVASGEANYNPKETFFTITRIHVLNTLSEGYLTAEVNKNATRPALTAKSSLADLTAIDVSGVSGINDGIAMGSFYIWPGELAKRDNIKTDGYTVIEVEGYSVDGILRLFTVLLDSPQSIEANKRYILSVERISQTALTFAIKSTDWVGGASVEARPESPDGAFVYKEFNINGEPIEDSGDDVYADIDLSDNTDDNELRFYTESDSRATGELRVRASMTLGTLYAGDVTIETDGSSSVTYSVGKVKQYYKVLLKKTIYPIIGSITIDDWKNNAVTFNIRSVPYYPDTELRPVKVNGKYWAPVNVGATSTTYSEDLAGSGYVFQWGRGYVEFLPGVTGNTQAGPVSAELASTTYKDKFITASDWLSPRNNGLWSTIDPRGPCPAGWRVPTDTELAVLNSRYSTANIEGAPDNIRLRIPGDVENEDLYLPAAGYRSYNGTWATQGTRGTYWSSAVSGTSARYFNFYSGSSGMLTALRGDGLSVRCLQE